MSINAVFAHFICRSALKLRTRSSFLHILLWFFQNMERLLIFAVLPAEK
jgi:hypothetical protein